MYRIKKILLILKWLLLSPLIIAAGLLGALIGLFQGITDWIRKPKTRQNIVPVKYEIPDRFKDLVPLAERIGIGDDVLRTEMEAKLSQTEKQGISEQLRGRTEDLQQWIDSTNCADVAVPFMRLLEAIDEMGIWPDKDNKPA